MNDSTSCTPRRQFLAALAASSAALSLGVPSQLFSQDSRASTTFRCHRRARCRSHGSTTGNSRRSGCVRTRRQCHPMPPIAASLMLSVVDSHNSGLGGGCLALVRTAKGEVFAIDGRERAPMKANPEIFFPRWQTRSAAQPNRASGRRCPRPDRSTQSTERTLGTQRLGRFATWRCESGSRRFQDR